MIAYVGLIFYLTSLTMCYQRPSQNHNNFDEKATHPPHNFFGYKWSEPYFDLTMPRNVTSLVGKSAYLGCRVKNLGNKTVAWIRHRDLHILTVGTYTYTTDQRFQTTFHRDIDEWTMQIKWAQKRDAGTYECQISTQPVKSFSVDLEIVVPTATILGGPDLYVDKGSTINLTCAIKFSPEPPAYIFWYHEDKVMSDDSPRISFHTERGEVTKSILLIEDADIADSGKYSCFPSNTDIASIRVHVLNGERPEAMQTSGGSNLASTTAVYKILALLYIIYSQLGLENILNNFTLRPTKSQENDYDDMNEILMDGVQLEACNENSSSSIKNIQNKELCKLQRYQNSLRSIYSLR